MARRQGAGSRPVLLIAGTRKGAFFFRGDAARARWRMEGCHFRGQAVYHVAYDGRRRPTLLAAVSSDVWGGRVQISRDLGRRWSEPKAPPRFPRGSGRTLTRVWHIAPGRPEEPGVVHLGTDPAALFRSEDGGATWEVNRALLDHPTRGAWQPGMGGLALHTILDDPEDRRRMYVAISAAGVFRTDDGGRSWAPANRGVRADFLPRRFPEVGQCVHKLALHPARPGRLFQQNHCGVYRSDDRGETWVDLSDGLPSRFGFPLVIHPRDPDTVYLFPEESDQFRVAAGGRMAVWRSTNAGRTWRPLAKGFPRGSAWTNVLREAMAADDLEPAGLTLGTSTGHLWHSRDEGRSWRLLAEHLPPILSVACVRAG